eukprot:TRINITY_DN2165_c0_g1_i8.p1 TRINITY_DN2165_c0_g1~~TRINITY_DN2165_c0_g1_i8.p1  ORF type:complete len:119 (+),score=22.55 TRINITY_DN2165_c0_g1_i8:977-1333(+)
MQTSRWTHSKDFYAEKNIENEYNRRIKLLEEEYVQMAAQRLSHDLFNPFSPKEIALEDVINRMKEVVKDEMLREKEDFIKSLLDQIAHYKKRCSSANESPLLKPVSYTHLTLPTICSV